MSMADLTPLANLALVSAVVCIGTWVVIDSWKRRAGERDDDWGDRNG